MPLLKACPRCKRLMAYGSTYCPDCKPIAEAEFEKYRNEKAKMLQRQYNRRRDPKYLAFYRSKDWRTLSRTFMQSVGYKCQAHAHPDCTGLAVEVHHVVPIQTPEGWDRRLDWDNLEAVCTKCHNARHPEKGRGPHLAGVIDMRYL